MIQLLQYKRGAKSLMVLGRMTFFLVPTLWTAGVAQASLIGNGSFENVPGTGPGFQDQGLMPSGWPTASGTPDTYSNDGSFGLSPADFGNFPGITAFDGIRWVAGFSNGRTAALTSIGGEAFGTGLVSALSAGATYTIQAMLIQALRGDLNNPGGYDVFLATGNTAGGLAGAVLLGGLAPTTGIGGWESRSLSFVAPADAAARGFLIFAPYQAGVGGSSYPGIDAVSLNSDAGAVPEPASVAYMLVGAAGLGWLCRSRKFTRRR